ncbi:MAG: Imm52 family immunity protein [Beijerinckiaceae bacterium]
MSDLELKLWWEPRDPSQADDARRLSQFVTGLPDFDPIYRSWLESPKTRKETVPVPLSEAEAKQLLIDNVGQYDAPPGPWPELGSYIWGGHAGPPPYDFRKSSTAGTRCRVGAFGRSASINPNHVFMRLSELRPSTGRPWRASELRPLMKFAREIWSPAEMCAMFSFYNPPKIPDPTWAAGERTLEPWIGWITYLPPELAARAKYPVDVEVEALEDGAALVTLCEEPFGKTDAEGLARLHALEAALRPIQS